MLFHGCIPFCFVWTVRVHNRIQEEASDLKVVDCQVIPNQESLVLKVQVLIERFQPFWEVNFTNFVHDFVSILFVSEQFHQMLLEVSLEWLENLLSLIPLVRRIGGKSILVWNKVVDGPRLNQSCSISQLQHWHLSVLKFAFVFQSLHFLHVFDPDVLELNVGFV